MNEQNIQDETKSIIALQQDIEKQEQELLADPKFAAFLTRQKEVQKRVAAFWQEVERQMIDNDIKSVKGDWGSITIAERLNWKTDDSLPAKFYKKSVDTKKISDTYRLEGKEPKGAVKSVTKYLTKRIK